MSYGVSFGAKTYDRERWHCCSPRAAPYDDWVARGRPHDAVFQYKEHQGDNVCEYYLMPALGVAYVEAYFEFVVRNLSVVARVEVDVGERSVAVRRVLCERENYWGDDWGGQRPSLRSGSGGLSYYRRNVEDLGVCVSLEALVDAFFAPGWTLRPTPLTLPHTPSDLVTLAKTVCPRAIGDYRRGPWGKAVAMYPAEREEAATVVQRFFRGWRVRMAVRFNPHTAFGAWLERREFRLIGGPDERILSCHEP